MTTTLLKCEFCGQETTKNGQPFKNHSALNTHINMHCSKKPTKEKSMEHPMVTATKFCVHAYKLLNSNSTNETMQRIIAAGHTKGCSKCGDLQ